VVVLAFSVCRDELLSGAKRQTIRRLGRLGEGVEGALRRYRIRPGCRLHVWWQNPRTRKPDSGLLFLAECTSVVPITLHEEGYSVWRGGWFRPAGAAASEALARRDGFGNYAELLAWFRERYDIESSVFVVITWRRVVQEVVA